MTLSPEQLDLIRACSKDEAAFETLLEVINQVSAPSNLPFVCHAQLDAVDSHAAVIDQQGTIVAANRAWHRFAKINDFESRHHGLGMNYLAVCDRAAQNGCADAAEVAHGLRELLAGRILEFHYEYPCHTPQGEQRWFALHATRVAHDQFDGALLMHDNISERRLAEIALRESETRFRTLVISMEDLVYTLDRQERHTGVYGGWLKKYNLSPEMFLGKTARDMLDDTAATLHENANRRALAGESVVYEWPLGDKYVLTSLSPLRDEAGNITGIVGVGREITALKQMEQALRDSNRRYDELVANIPGMVYRLRSMPDGSMAFEYVSPRCRDLNGVDPEIVLSQPDYLFNTIHPDDRASYWQNHQEAVQSIQPFYWEGRVIINGQQRWRRLESRPTLQDDGSVLWDGIQVDTTDQKNAEEALRRSETRYRIVSELSSDYAFLMDVLPDGSVTRAWITDAFERITGYRPDELRTDGGWTALVHPDDLPALEEHLAALVQSPGELETEYRIIARGGQIKHLWGYYRSILDERQGRVTQVYGVASDITESKRALAAAREQERLQIALQKEQELSLLKSKMMERIAHEFRTPLCVILSSTEILERYANRLNPEQMRGHFRQIKQHMAQLTGMLDNISQVMQGGVSQLEFRPAAFDLHQAAQALVEDLREQFPHHRLIFSDRGDLRSIYADADLVRQMISNLLLNALRYSPPETTVWLEIAPEGDDLVLRVRDMGPGIAPEDRPHIFEPFYRGANAGDHSGLGLGLSLVKEAAALHEGSVSFESAPGKGAVFTVHLPWKTGNNRRTRAG